MRRLRPVVMSWLCASCATSAATSSPAREPEVHAERCVSAAAPSVGAAVLQRLGGATNVLEYQDIWKAEHAGAMSGNIGASEVRARVHAKLPEIQACYESALSRSADGAGRVVVRFVIDASGRVAAANIAADSFGSQEVSCCVVRRVAQWSFAPVTGDFVVVEYPFAVRMAHGR
jgi:TonB family protein